VTALRLLQTMSVPRIASRCHVTGLSVSVDIAEKKGSGLIAIYTRLSITYTVNIALFRMLLPPTVKERALLEAVGRRLLQPPTLRRRSRANASCHHAISRHILARISINIHAMELHDSPKDSPRREASKSALRPMPIAGWGHVLGPGSFSLRQNVVFGLALCSQAPN